MVSGSLRQSSVRQAPATVHVITAEQIKASGAQTVWDVLRLAPGVDVSAVGTFQGEVSIRGLNKTGNNRTLVMVDGRTVLHGFLGNLTWEALPLGLEEIERIEVVAGPSSAVYGGNALSGAVNIITKAPGGFSGGRLSYAQGERDSTAAGYQVGGRTRSGVDYKASAGYRAGNEFRDASLRASEAGTFNTALRWSLTPESELTLSGGASRHDTRVGGSDASANDSGVTGFTRADYRRKSLRGRLFWNSGRTVFKDFPVLANPNFDYDTYDFQVDQGFAPGESHDLVLGASVRRNTARSSIFTGRVSQDLFALFGEDQWRLTDRWTAVAGARLDHHPLAGWMLSPRTSLLFAQSEAHAWRASASSAFRNPNLLENYVNLTAAVPGAVVTLLGNAELRPERLYMFEAGHQGRFGRVKTFLTGFQYTLRDIVGGTSQRVTALGPPLRTEVVAINAGATRALGYEAGGEFACSPLLTLFASYSYQSLKDENATQTTAVSAPKHKANAGLRLRRGGFSGGLWAHWTDQTLWTQGQGRLARVPDYYLLNASAAYAFSKGRLDGFEVFFSGFNLADRRHHEMAPLLSAAQPGQSAVLVRARLMAGGSYRF